MIEFGFVIVDRDECVFRYKSEEGEMVVATVVDDSVCAFDNDDLFGKFVEFVKSSLPIMENPVSVTELTNICGVEIERDPETGSIKCRQTEMIEKVAARYGIETEGRRYDTPMEYNYKPSNSKDRPVVPDEERVQLARSLVGSLVYLTITRPEIRFACSKLARVVQNPTEKEIDAMQRVVKYLYDTGRTPLMFSGEQWLGPDGELYEADELCVAVHASLAGEEKLSSQTGIAAFFGGACFFGKSGRQTQLADSSGYAETIALHEAVQHVVDLQRLLLRLGVKLREPTKMFDDSTAAIAFAEKGMGDRSKHYALKYLWVTERVHDSTVQMVKVPTGAQPGDVLTKALPVEAHLLLSEMLLGHKVVFKRPRRETRV